MYKSYFVMIPMRAVDQQPLKGHLVFKEEILSGLTETYYKSAERPSIKSLDEAGERSSGHLRKSRCPVLVERNFGLLPSQADSWCSFCFPEGPSTQYFRTLVSKIISVQMHAVSDTVLLQLTVLLQFVCSF